MQKYKPLDIKRLHSTLKTSSIGHTVQYTVATPSTMTIAHAIAGEAHKNNRESPHGVLVLTEEQTAGRGRRGRGWNAPPGQSLLVSILLKSPHLQRYIARVPMLCGPAALEAIESVLQGVDALHAGKPSLNLGLKWPNDLVIGQVQQRTENRTDPSYQNRLDPTTLRKVGGILIENVFQPAVDAPHGGYAVAGFGINVNQRAENLPQVAPPALSPASLHTVTGRTFDRTQLLIELCRSLAVRIERMEIAVAESIANARSSLDDIETFAEWRNRLLLMGEPIQVYPRDREPYPATAHTVTLDGDLVVKDEQGVMHTLTAEDVSIRPAHQYTKP